MSFTPNVRTMNVLEDDALRIPKARGPGDFSAFLSREYGLFFGAIAGLDGRLGKLISERSYWMHDLAGTCVAVVDCTRQGRHERAWQLIEDALDEQSGTLRIMSLRHALKVTGSRSWYRLTTLADAKSRNDVFHLPFEMKAKSYRFSSIGRPALYLGNNIHVCWLECQRPDFAACRAARFEIEAEGWEFLDLPANHASYLDPLRLAVTLAQAQPPAGDGNPPNPVPLAVDPRRVMNSPYWEDVELELAEYLSIWPLLMACTVEKLESLASPPEYLISQLLMQWVLKQKNLLGIRYFTSKSDPTTNSNDMSINVVLPARTTDKEKGFCDFLVERVRCTRPQTFADAERILDADLFTEAAADIRQAAQGRYMTEWKGGHTTYQYTPFGRLEYWLDRPEFPARRIDEV